MARADRVTVVADSSKLGNVAFARICELAEVNELITDDGADPGTVRAIEDAGVRVTIV
jgi:DeoR family transcriptional regulator of aga operon